MAFAGARASADFASAWEPVETESSDAAPAVQETTQDQNRAWIMANGMLSSAAPFVGQY